MFLLYHNLCISVHDFVECEKEAAEIGKKGGQDKMDSINRVPLDMIFFTSLYAGRDFLCVEWLFSGAFHCSLMYSENMKACLMFANVTAVLRKA